MSKISELAVIDPGARIGENVSIGPFCVIGAEVSIGDGCEIKNNVTIDGTTSLGENNVIYPYAVVGVAPVDLKYKGGVTETIIGDSNVIREHVTIHRGTELGGNKTVVGDNNLLMVGSHVAHDCIIQNHTLIGNQVLMAGHVKIEDGAVVSAMAGIHHFVSIGRYSYIGAMTPVRRDVPPFMKVSGDPPEVRGVNTQGLNRNGFSSVEMTDMKQAYKKIFLASKNGKTLLARLEALEEKDLNVQVNYLCDFMRRSYASRFGRAEETRRQDKPEDRSVRNPNEIQKNYKKE